MHPDRNTYLRGFYHLKHIRGNEGETAFHWVSPRGGESGRGYPPPGNGFWDNLRMKTYGGTIGSVETLFWPSYSDEAGAGPGLSPCTGPWRLSPLGVGLTGSASAASMRNPEGFEGVSPPLSRATIRRSQAPPRPRFGLLLRTFGAHAPALWPIAPRPSGRGQSWRYPGESRAPEGGYPEQTGGASTKPNYQKPPRGPVKGGFSTSVDK